MAEPRHVVAVIDDDRSVREALVRLLDASGHTAAAYSSAEEFLAAADRPDLGCAVLDVRMPGLSGLGLRPRLEALLPACPVIFLTGHGDIPMAVRAIKDGAFEFLTKPVDEAVLLDAVDRALAEHARRRTDLIDAARAQALLAELTPREREVFSLVITGALNKEIAARLGISEKTVKIHRANLRAKLGVDSVVDLLAIARRAGLAEQAGD